MPAMQLNDDGNNFTQPAFGVGYQHVKPEPTKLLPSFSGEESSALQIPAYAKV
ncbi:UNVERIFIED_CONTAM: hypothetical protein FKN15_058244 [Acipenser sinensis]